MIKFTVNIQKMTKQETLVFRADDMWSTHMLFQFRVRVGHCAYGQFYARLPLFEPCFLVWFALFCERLQAAVPYCFLYIYIPTARQGFTQFHGKLSTVEVHLDGFEGFPISSWLILRIIVFFQVYVHRLLGSWQSTKLTWKVMPGKLMRKTSETRRPVCWSWVCFCSCFR